MKFWEVMEIVGPVCLSLMFLISLIALFQPDLGTKILGVTVFLQAVGLILIRLRGNKK